MGVHWHQQKPGTVKWILKHKCREEKPEYWIFLGKGQRMPLKRHLWQTHVGEIPKGYVIRYKDGNPRRCILSNLECITRGENGKRNRRNKPEIYEKIKAFFKTEKGKRVAKERAKKTLSWWATQGKERRNTLLEKSKKKRETHPDLFLTDKVIAFYLTTHKPDIRQEVLENKELINLKRTQIKLKKLCQTLHQDQKEK